MNVLLIIYVAISITFGIVKTVNVFKGVAGKAKWYQYILGIPLIFILEAAGWPIICIALGVYYLWLKAIS